MSYGEKTPVFNPAFNKETPPEKPKLWREGIRCFIKNWRAWIKWGTFLFIFSFIGMNNGDHEFDVATHKLPDIDWGLWSKGLFFSLIALICFSSRPVFSQYFF